MRKIMIGMPMLSTVLAALLTYEYFAIDSYNWWYTTLFPAMTALVCGMISSKDKKMNDKAILSLPCDMGKVWDAKIFMGVVVSGFSVLCAGIFTLAVRAFMKAGLHVGFIIEPSVIRQAAGCLVIWAASLWQVPFCLLAARKIGTLPMLLLHIIGSVIAGMLFSIKSWYFLLPGAIMPRLMCSVLGILPNGLPAVEGSFTYTPELAGLQNLLVGIPAALLWFIFFWWVSRRWFERQVA